MNDKFRYEPDSDESISMAVVRAVTLAHHEDIVEQDWIISDDVDPDALDKLFQREKPNITVQFETDRATVTIDTDEDGSPIIEVEPCC